MCSTKKAQWKTLYPNDNIQKNSREKYAHSYITFIQINCNFLRVLVQFYTLIYCLASLSGRVYDSGHPVAYTIIIFTNKPSQKYIPLHVSTLHKASYPYTQSYDSTYKEIFCTSMSPALDITLYVSTLHKTSYAFT